MQNRPLGLLSAAALLAVSLAGEARAGDEWLVYIGGGLEAVEGGWTERGGQVIFTRRGGTLVSVPFDEVDLPASAFITWQLGGRRQPPPRPPLPTPPEAAVDSAPCDDARLVRLLGGESLEVAVGERLEIVHLACLDAPETRHQFPELGWFGRAALSAVELELPVGSSLCLRELSPPQRDGEGHRIVHVALADGRDYAAEMIAGGLALLRPGPCNRAADYRRFEDQAIRRQRGLWGPGGQRAAFAAVGLSAAVSAGPAPRRRPGGG